METTRELLTQLQKTVCDQYAEQLNALPFAKKTREAIIDGFRDGCRAGIHHTVKMLGVTVKGEKP